MKSGICIDGPRQGEIIQHDDKFFKTDVLPGFATAGDWTGSDFSGLTDKEFVYEWVYYCQAPPESGRVGQGFWVPQGKDVMWAIKQLVDNYSDAT